MKPNKDYESLDSYFRNLRDRVGDAEKDYPKLESVVKGETTLVDIVNEYENRFYQLLNNKTVLLDKLRIKRFGNEVTKYSQELGQFTGVLDDLSNCSALSSSTLPEDYRKYKSNKVSYDAGCGILFGGMGAAILALILPPSLPALIALVIAGGAVSGGGIAAAKSEPYVLSSRGARDWEYLSKDFFKRLKESAETMDKELRSAYAIDYFMHNRDLFKGVYNGLDTPKTFDYVFPKIHMRDYVNTKLAQMQELGLLDISASQLESFLEGCAQGEKENEK